MLEVGDGVGQRGDEEIIAEAGAALGCSDRSFARQGGERRLTKIQPGAILPRRQRTAVRHANNVAATRPGNVKATKRETYL
jgi:hypothetical protein